MSAEILIATPQIEFGELLQMNLEESGQYQTQLVSSAQDALDALDASSFSVIILDATLKDRPFAATVQIVTRKKPGIRVIIVPPNNDPKHPSIQGIKSDGFLSRPFFLPDLLSMIEILTGGAFGYTETGSAGDEPNPDVKHWRDDVGVATRHLERLLHRSSARAALIVRNGRMWAHAGDMPNEEISEVIDLLSHNLEPGSQSDLARFVRLKSSGAEYKLYATLIGGGFILGMVNDNTMSLSRMRSETMNLVNTLTNGSPEKEDEEETGSKDSKAVTPATTLPSVSPEEEEAQSTLAKMLANMPSPDPSDDESLPPEVWVPENLVSQADNLLDSYAPTRPVVVRGDETPAAPTGMDEIDKWFEEELVISAGQVTEPVIARRNNPAKPKSNEPAPPPENILSGVQAQLKSQKVEKKQSETTPPAVTETNDPILAAVQAQLRAQKTEPGAAQATSGVDENGNKPASGPLSPDEMVDQVMQRIKSRPASQIHTMPAESTAVKLEKELNELLADKDKEKRGGRLSALLAAARPAQNNGLSLEEELESLLDAARKNTSSTQEPFETDNTDRVLNDVLRQLQTKKESPDAGPPSTSDQRARELEEELTALLASQGMLNLTPQVQTPPPEPVQINETPDVLADVRRQIKTGEEIHKYSEPPSSTGLSLEEELTRLLNEDKQTSEKPKEPARVSPEPESTRVIDRDNRAPTARVGVFDTEAEIPEVPMELPGQTVPSSKYSSYTCILVPNLADYSLGNKIAAQLRKWMPQFAVAFGWHLEKLVLQPTYMQWTMHVAPGISPGNLVRTIRQRTSQRIFSQFPEIKTQNSNADFWAPGYLVVSGSQPPPQEFLDDFIQQTRRRQKPPNA